MSFLSFKLWISKRKKRDQERLEEKIESLKHELRKLCEKSSEVKVGNIFFYCLNSGSVSFKRASFCNYIIVLLLVSFKYTEVIFVVKM